MKIYSAYLQFGLCLATYLPMPSHAALEVPYWLHPQWIVGKVVDFHARNTERIELAEKVDKVENKVDKVKNVEKSAPVQTNTPAKSNVTTPTQPDNVQRGPRLAPVEFATPKTNEKHLSKDELYELRMQLKQRP